MTQKAAVRAGIERHIETSGGVHHDPITTLSRELKSDPKVVSELVDSLDRAGKLSVARNNGAVTSVRPKEHISYDRTSFSVGAKRERTFAKGVPAYLPNSMCSAVTVIPPKEQEVVSEKKENPLKGMSQLERLNLVFTCLRLRADEHGELPAGSVVDMLVAELAVTQGMATKLNGILGKLGLRTTKNFGAQFDQDKRMVAPIRYVSTVDIDCQEITQAMLDTLDASEKSLSHLEAESEQESKVTRVCEVVDDVSIQLAAIIQQLERSLEKEGVRNGKLKLEVQALKQENTELKAKISQSSEHAPVVVEILSRYQKK